MGDKWLGNPLWNGVFPFKTIVDEASNEHSLFPHQGGSIQERSSAINFFIMGPGTTTVNIRGFPTPAAGGEMGHGYNGFPSTNVPMATGQQQRPIPSVVTEASSPQGGSTNGSGVVRLSLGASIHPRKLEAYGKNARAFSAWSDGRDVASGGLCSIHPKQNGHSSQGGGNGYASPSPADIFPPSP